MARAYGTSSLGTSTSAAPTLAVPVAANTGVCVAIQWDAAATFTSLASSLSNTYTLVGAEVNAAGARTRVYRSVPTNVAGGTDTLTFNLSSSVLSVRTYDTFTGISSGTDSGTPTVDAASPWTGTNVTPANTDSVLATVCVNNSTNAASTFTAGNGYTKTNEDANGSTEWPMATGYKLVASTTADGASWTCSQGTSAFVWNVSFSGAGGSPATLSAATPSGTLGTATTATLGATSDQTTGTLYGVVSTTNNVATATATQIKAGQNSTGAAAAFSNNAAVSTTSPSVGISGLTASTAYFYAEVQNNTNGDSNVVSGSFTTAAASTPRGNLLLLGVG